MGKRDRTDLISDAHERANNNINPYHWFNRVTPFTMARMKASLAFSWIDLILMSLFMIALYTQWERLTSSITGYFGIALIAALWVLSFLRFMRWLAYKMVNTPIIHRPKERKKRHPKRPKNYGRD